MESTQTVEEEKIVDESHSSEVEETINPYLALRISSGNPLSSNETMKNLLFNDLNDEEAEQCLKLEKDKLYGMVEITQCLRWSEVEEEYKNDDININQMKVIKRWIKDKTKQIKDKNFIVGDDEEDEEDEERKTKKRKDTVKFDPWCYRIGRVIKFATPISFKGSRKIQQISPDVYRKICNDENVKKFPLQNICRRILTGFVDRYIFGQMMNGTKTFELRSQHYEGLNPRIMVCY